MTERSDRRVECETLVRAARDLALVESYRRGDLDALERLLRVYAPQVRRILTKLGVASGDLDDLGQDVALRIFRNLDRFRGQSSYYTWLYRITVNVCLDHMKKRKRAELRLTRMQGDFVDAGRVRQRACPYERYLDIEIRNAFSEALAALPSVFEPVVTMRVIHDLSYHEIARHFGLSVGTVRSRLARGRGRLRVLLRSRLDPLAA